MVSLVDLTCSGWRGWEFVLVCFIWLHPLGMFHFRYRFLSDCSGSYA